MSAFSVLIVEDEGLVALEIQDQLAALTYQVVGVAATGEQAIKLAQQHYPDLILMDIMLRGDMDGIVAAHKIQQILDVPVVYLTAHSDEVTLQRAKVTHPLGYVVKPFDGNDLYIAIEVALYRHQLDQKLRASEERLRLVIESGNDIIATTDLDGRCTYIHSPSLYGRQFEDAVGKLPHDIFAHHTAGQGIRLVKKVMKTARPITIEAELSFEGQTYWFNEHIYPLKDKAGKVTGAAIIARDISEIKRLMGMLSICAWCGSKIKDKNGQWQRLDIFLIDHADIEVTHGLCPDCHKQIQK